MKFKFSNKHTAMLKMHARKIIPAAILIIALMIGLVYKHTMMADGDSAARGALFGGLGGAAVGGAFGGARGAGIGLGVGLLSGAAIGGASSSSHSSVSPETKRLNSLYKQIDKKQAKLNSINKRIATAKENKRQSLINQAEQYSREINDLQNQANAIVKPQPQPSMNNNYGRMRQ